MAGSQEADPGWSTSRRHPNRTLDAARIQQLIQTHYKVRYSTAWISIRLCQLGLSVQRPQTTAHKKDDELAEAWVRQDWPAIKKASERGAHIMFADEFGLSFRHRVATTCRAVGHTPMFRHEDKRRALSCFCGLTTSGKLYTVYFTGSINGDRVVTALKYIRQYLKGELIIIRDRLKAHKGAAVREYLEEDTELEVIELPAYSPELNPEGYCHGYGKEHLRNLTTHSEQELIQAAEREFARIRRRPKLLRSFFDHAKIPIMNQSG